MLTKGAATCSRACANALSSASPKPCDDCGRPTSRGRNRNGRICLECTPIRRQARNRRKNVKRRGARVIGPGITLEQLGDRDRWTCHLCHQRVSRRLRSPHPRSATFDHLVPIADGGVDHTANLALAHRECNVRRGVGGTVQLLLIGDAPVGRRA